MKIEIKLKDNNYCNDCPCFDGECLTCHLKLFPKLDPYDCVSFIRPQECKDKYGE